MKKLTTILAILTTSLLTFAHAELLLQDTFNVTGPGGDENYELSERQSGTLAPLTYSVSAVDKIHVTNAGPSAGKCRITDGSGTYTMLSPDYNFNESGNFSVEFELTHNTSSDKSLDIGFGQQHTLQWPIGVGTKGFAIRFWDNGLYTTYVEGIRTGWFNVAQSLSYPIKIKIVVSQSVFPPTNDAQVAFFINDIPYPIVGGLGATAEKRYVFTYAGGFSNNYITLQDREDGGVIDIDNLRIKTLTGDKFSTTNWTDDADSGVTNTKTYSHALNLASTADITINGVTFTGSGQTYIGSDWYLKGDRGDGGQYNDITVWGFSPNLTNSSLGLVTNNIYNNITSYGLILSNLNAGQGYKLSIYGIGWTGADKYESYFVPNDGGVIGDLNQNVYGLNEGIIHTYRYIAPEGGIFSISTRPVNSNFWPWFAFSNELVPPDAPETVSATKGTYSDKIRVSWTEVNAAQYYLVYRADTDNLSATNYSVQVTTNYYDDSSVVTAQDYYYGVAALNAGGLGPVAGSALGFTASTAPDTPTGISPINLSVVTSPVTFTASTYNDTSGFAFEASRWQVSADSDFSSLEWDSSETLPRTSMTAPRSGVPAGTNYWRVRYMNDRNTWSAWSDSNQFICIPGETQSGIFKDNFNVIPTGDINTEYDAIGRQSGEVSPLVYTVSGTTEVGSSSAHPGKLTLGQNAGCSPNDSFENPGGFNIKFDVRVHNLDESSDWFSLALGKDDQSSLLPESASGLAAAFSADRNFSFYDGTKLISSLPGLPSNQEFHVMITTSTEEFDEGDPVYYAVFVNGIPQPIEDAFRKYSYTMANGFMKNYVTLFNNNTMGTSSSVIDNFEISAAPTNVLTVHPWTGNTDSLIDPIKEYTHLVNISGDDVTINGHEFIGTGILTNQGFNNGDPHYTTSTWALIDAVSYLVAWTQVPPPIPNLTGESFDLGQFGVIGAGSPAIVLSELTPNSSNTLFIYSWARENGTEITFPSSYGGVVETIDVDQYGQLNGIIIQYDYIADENGKFTVAATPETDALRFFICGFANEETGIPEPVLLFIYYLLFILIWRNVFVTRN